jgi:hypothetical protein
MTPELEGSVKKHSQLFGSYTRAGELKQVRVWLMLNEGRIEFLTPVRSLKAKRVSRNPRVECLVGEHRVPGVAVIVRDRDAVQRAYRAYWKTHPFIMLFIAFGIRSRIRAGEQALIRVTPDEPNPFDGITDPLISD